MSTLRFLLSTGKRLFAPVFDNKSLAGWLFLTTVMWGLFGIFNVYMIKVLVDDIEAGALDLLVKHLLIYVGIIIVYQLTNFAIVRKGYIHYGIHQTLNRQLLYQYATADNTHLERYGTGRLIAIIGGGIDTWKHLIMQFFISFPEFLVSFVYAIILLSQLGWIAILVFLGLLIGSQLITLQLNAKAHLLRKDRYELETHESKSLVRFLMSKFEVLQADKIQYEIDQLNATIDQQWAIEKKKHFYEHWAFVLPDQTILLVKIGLFFFLGGLVIKGETSIANLLLYVSLLTYVDSTMKSFLGGVVKTLIKSFASIERLRELFDTLPPLSGFDTGADFVCGDAHISLENVSFDYDQNILGDKRLFSQFSLTLGGGAKTAIVGESGSGKSTLVKLISGYIQADEGAVIIDGQKISDISLRSYYNCLGYLTQEPSIFDGTIYDNLTYAMSGTIDDAELTRILGLAQCDFVFGFTEGLHTEIGERGIRLSGGQRQRLAIAKVMLKDPRIIILDEPTSALDSFSEELISKAMNNLFRGRTVIIIAHRLQTVKDADDIIVLHDGKILERGTHETLTALGGSYATMLKLQSGF